MKNYQFDISQIESTYNTNVGSGLASEMSEGMQTHSNVFKEWIVGTSKECVTKFSYAHVLALICFAIALIFGILNQMWPFFWCVLASLFIYFILFGLECGALYFLKRNYFKHIDNFDAKIEVLRNGTEKAITLSELRIGDVVCLKEGTVLRGDARIVSANRLFADESVVFGKTIPSAKDDAVISAENVLPEDQRNMLWKGSYITSGNGKAVIVALDEDCYVYKTGGRKKRDQRSYVYNRRNNVGKIISLAFLVLCIILFLLAAIISGRWTECFAILGVITVFISLEPVSCITEWNYYYSAKRLYSQGALIRNIAIFDKIENEKDIYFEIATLLNGQQRYNQIIPIKGEKNRNLLYFSLLNDSLDLNQQSDVYNLNILKASRKEEDEQGNVLSVLNDEGASVLVASGYWKAMFSYVSIGEDFSKMAEEFENHGKTVYLLATAKKTIPTGSLTEQAKIVSFEPMALVVFDIEKNEQIYQMINRLKRSGLKTHLICSFSEALGKNLCTLYDMNSVIISKPERRNCSIPEPNSDVVCENASMIAKEKAAMILTDGTMPQKIIYAVKCMFCGINRSLKFLGMIAGLTLISVFILILKGAPAPSILFPLLTLQPALICACYFLAETVRNCNQSGQSLVMGALFGLPILIAALVGSDMVLLVPGLSVVLYGTVLCAMSFKHRAVRAIDICVIMIALSVVLIPWIFIGGNWLVALLFASFPVAAAVIIDLIY